MCFTRNKIGSGHRVQLTNISVTIKDKHKQNKHKRTKQFIIKRLHPIINIHKITTTTQEKKSLKPNFCYKRYITRHITNNVEKIVKQNI